MMKKLLRLLPVFLAAAFLLTACGTADEHLWVKSPGWSRAVLLGDSGAAAPVAVWPDGDAVYALLLPADRDQHQYRLRLVRLDVNSGQTISYDYPDVFLRLPRQLDMVPSESGLRFFWLDDETLFTAEGDLQGHWLDKPQALNEARPVGNFVVLPSGDSAFSLLLGGTRRAPGVDVLSADGSRWHLSDDGIWPRAIGDSQGNIHLAWAFYPPGYGDSALYYAEKKAGADWDSVQPQRILPLAVSTSTRLNDLALGADDTHLYLMWTTKTVAGLEAGTVKTRLLATPLGQPFTASPEDVYVPFTYDLPFVDAYPADVLTGSRADLQTAPFAPNDALEDLRFVPRAASESVLAYRSNMLHLWRKQRFQVNVLYLDGGQAAYVQPLSFTSTYSLKPYITLGNEGALYITWLEKITDDNYSVYLSSTRPQIVHALAAMTWQERGGVVLQTLFGLLIGALLAPLAASVWMLAPLFVLLLLGFFKRWLPSAWAAVWEYITLGMAIFAFWGAKRATLPGMFAYVPFSAWVPGIPDWLGLVLRYAVPVLILGLAFFVAWHYTYRRGNRSALYFLMAYMGVDALLTTAIYAVLIYGVF